MQQGTTPAVQLTGQDGNVFAVIGLCAKALRRAGMQAEAQEFKEKCLASHSYDEVLRLAMEYCNVE